MTARGHQEEDDNLRLRKMRVQAAKRAWLLSLSGGLGGRALSTVVVFLFGA